MATRRLCCSQRANSLLFRRPGSVISGTGCQRRLFLGWAKALHAEEHYFPSFIALKDLKPLAYLRSFPHLVTFAGTVPDDKQILSDFAATNGDAEVVAFGAEGMAVTELLTPAACYHFYHRLANCELEDDLFLTTRCPCHRREKYYTT